MLRDCRLNGYHLMVIRHNGSDATKEYTTQYLTNNRHLKDVARYLNLIIDGTKPLEADDMAFAESSDWSAVGEDEIFVQFQDSDGNELDRITLNVDAAIATKNSDGLILKHAPATADAKKKWDDAFALASETGRRVWASEGGRYCGPCFRLTRWIDDHKDLLEQDYVFVKVDSYMDEHGIEVAERITRGGQHGIPFFAIFNADGELLIDSDGPLGNIGMPNGFEGSQHLGKMLNQTRQRLSFDDVNSLIESLR